VRPQTVRGTVFRNAGISAPRVPRRTHRFAGMHNPDMAEEAEPAQPTGRDYGCGLVAVFAAVMIAGPVVGAIAVLFTDGPSISLALRLGLIALFWYWIAMGAWRRTIWSSRP
jgi:hypothetical protein